MEKECDIRCRSANPKSTCHCRCGGLYHGEWFGGSNWANRVEVKNNGGNGTEGRDTEHKTESKG
jgi:hypothetical protein